MCFQVCVVFQITVHMHGMHGIHQWNNAIQTRFPIGKMHARCGDVDWPNLNPRVYFPQPIAGYVHECILAQCNYCTIITHVGQEVSRSPL